jgi:hypothetical protein
MKVAHTFGIIVAYAMAGGAVLFMAFSAWFAAMWGVSTLAAFPFYIFGLIVFGGCLAVARVLTKSP